MSPRGIAESEPIDRGPDELHQALGRFVRVGYGVVRRHCKFFFRLCSP